MEFCCNVGYFSQFLILAIAIFKPFGLEAGQHCHESLPVSRSNMAQVKDAIKRV